MFYGTLQILVKIWETRYADEVDNHLKKFSECLKYRQNQSSQGIDRLDIQLLEYWS